MDFVLNLKNSCHDVLKDVFVVHLLTVKFDLRYKTVCEDIIRFFKKNKNLSVVSLIDFYKPGFVDWSGNFLRSSGIAVDTYRYSGINNLISMISSSVFIVTNKLHCGIVAVTQEVPVVSIGAHEKTTRFFRQTNCDLQNTLLDYYEEGDFFKLKLAAEPSQLLLELGTRLRNMNFSLAEFVK